jgi:biopolymer transport protein ExbB
MQTYGIAQSVASWYGALVMGMIFVMSIYMVATAIVRYRFFSRCAGDGVTLLKDAEAVLTDAKGARDVGGFSPSDPPLRIMIATLLKNRELQPEELDELRRLTLAEQRDRVTKGLSVFGTFATIGPFIGLFATVLGIIESFHNLGASGAAGPNVIAGGVAAALWGTAAGLALAIPAVVLYNIINRKARRVMSELEIVGQKMILLLRLHRRHARLESAAL